MKRNGLWECGLDLSGSEQGSVNSPVEHNNEHLGSISIMLWPSHHYFMTLIIFAEDYHTNSETT
jgi:hypothetical protein